MYTPISRNSQVQWEKNGYKFSKVKNLYPKNNAGYKISRFKNVYPNRTCPKTHSVMSYLLEDFPVPDRFPLTRRTCQPVPSSEATLLWTRRKASSSPPAVFLWKRQDRHWKLVVPRHVHGRVTVVVSPIAAVLRPCLATPSVLLFARFWRMWRSWRIFCLLPKFVPRTICHVQGTVEHLRTPILRAGQSTVGFLCYDLVSCTMQQTCSKYYFICR